MMKKVIFLFLYIFGVSILNLSYSQSNNDVQSRDSQWLMQLRPGMTHSAYWFLWAGGSTAVSINAQLETPTAWISEIIMDDTTSTSCSDINTMRLNLVAPTEPGVYTARILDLNLNYDPINITLLVSDILVPLDSLNLNAVVNQELLIPEPRLNDGKSNLGCIDPFYPSTSESYEFFWITGGIPGTITTTPSEFTLLNDEQIIIQNSALFTQAGNYTAYRLGKVEFSSALWVLKVNFNVTDTIIGINDIANKDSKIAYPNPAKDFIFIPNTGQIVIRSIDGKIIKTLNSDNVNSSIKVDISGLIPGIYFAQSGENTFKIVKQ
jgi:hypothetical protein